jgi:hypothetical protein
MTPFLSRPPAPAHRRPARASARWAAVALAALVMAAVALRSHALHVPGPNPDELLYAYHAERLRHDDPPAAVVARVGGRALPVGLDGYQGAVPVYIHALLSAGTDHPLRFRMVNLAYAAAIIALISLLAWGLWGPAAGVYAAGLLATMPAFVFYARIGEIVILVRVALVCGALYGWFAWSVRGRGGGLYAAGVLLGLGISTRLETAWWIAGAGAYLALANRPLLARSARALRAHPPRAAAVLACVVAGAAPFVAYNLTTGFGTLTQIRQNLTTTGAGHRNLAVLDNVGVRAVHLRQLLDGGDLWGVPRSPANPLMPAAFAVGAATLAARVALARRTRAPRRLEESLLFMTAALLVLSTFSPSTLNIGHLFILLPLPVLILVRFLALPGVRRVAAAVVVALMATNLAADVRAYRALAADGGRGYFSPAAYTLADDLRRFGARAVVTCDWGLARLVYYFSAGRVKTTEVFGYRRETPPEFFREVDQAVAGGATHFLFYASGYSVFPREDDFVAHAARRGLTLRRHTIADAHGAIYVLYEVVRRAGEDG